MKILTLIAKAVVEQDLEMNGAHDGNHHLKIYRCVAVKRREGEVFDESQTKPCVECQVLSHRIATNL